MNYRKIASIAVFFILSAAATPSLTIAESHVPCALSQNDFSKISAAQNNSSLDYSSEIKTELAIRKEILNRIVDCLAQEAQGIKSDIAKADAETNDEKQLQLKFSDWIADVISFYSIQKNQIDGLGLQGSKDLAKNMATWREGNFKPMANLANHFLLWSKNQEIMRIARNRVDKMGKSIDILHVGGYEDVRNKWQDVSDSLRDALAFNDRAKEILRMSGTAEDSFAAIRSSLESLGKTYTDMLDLVDAIYKEIGGK